MTETAGPVGRFISIEGPDGAGKTVVASRLADELRAASWDVVLTREPGGTALGEAVRDVLMHVDSADIDPVADALLFNAARAQHVARIIRPAVVAGRTVITARYADSTLAYQGYAEGADLVRLREIIAIATGGLVPDRTILLDLPAEAGLRRKAPDQHTRFEAAYDLGYHRRVRDGFLELAALEPRRWRVVDADRDLEAVLADVRAAVLELGPHGLSEPTAAGLRTTG